MTDKIGILTHEEIFVPSTGADPIGRVLANRYRVVDRLGEGGMAVVFQAVDERLKADVVLKMPLPDALAAPDFRPRFEREIRSLVHLRHPHVVDILDIGEDEGMPFAVMPFLAGGNLNDRQPRGNNGEALPVKPASLRDWLPQVAGALDHVHQQGYLHRDVKPANILFDQHGNAFLSDFGIVKALAANPRKNAANRELTEPGTILGTPEYMAPEMIRGEKVDGRADQFGLAVTVYEMLAVQVPVKGSSVADVMVNRARNPAKPIRVLNPGLSPALSTALARALSDDPKARFPDCASFARAVLAGLDAPVSPTPPTPPAVHCPRCRKAFRWNAEKAGSKVRCSGCHTAFVVPGDPSSAMARQPTNEPTQAYPQPGSKRKGLWIILGVGVGCVVLAAIAGLVVLAAFGALWFGSMRTPTGKEPGNPEVSATTHSGGSPPVGLPARELILEDNCDSKETSKIKFGGTTDDRVYKGGTVTAASLSLATLEPGDYECEIRARLAPSKSANALNFRFSFESDDRKAAISRDMLVWSTDTNGIARVDRQIWLPTDNGSRKDRDIPIWTDSKKSFNPNEFNTLTFTIRGQKAVFAVNEKPIQEVSVPLTGRTGKTDEKGKFRFFLSAAAKQKVELDYVKVWRLNAP
jgi:serine/threonine protein kinase